MTVGLKNLIYQNLEENKMKSIWGLLCLTLLSNADDLDIFDIVDSDINTTQSVNQSHKGIRIKLSHLLQNNSTYKSVLYANMSDNKENYVYDLRIEANEDIQSLHIKDLYYKTAYNERYFFELGRMNVKEGIASGYNPTDYFKGGSSFTLSVDPKEKKENRLGALLIQASAILDDMTIKVLYSPEVSVKSQSIWANKNYLGVHLDESNNQDRTTLYVGYTGFDTMSISGLLHSNNEGLNLGLNLSYIDEGTIWYMEGSVVEKKSNIDTILGTQNPVESYSTELSLGVNYTSSTNIVSTFEYIYNHAGLDSSDWKNYFAVSKKSPQSAGELAKARGALLGHSKMMSKHTLFMMARQSDVLTNLDWSLLTWVNAIDKSSLLQVGMSYAYEEVLFSLDARAYMGTNLTEYGSYPNDYEGLLSMTYFF
jgi:hypothetical protein